MQIKYTENKNPGKLPPSDKLGFGRIFTDYMFRMDYTDAEGWHGHSIEPFAPITISPAANCIHYAAEVFEGLKAYRRPDGEVQLFRPWDNVSRMNDSAERIGLPKIGEADALKAIKAVVAKDARWVPSDPGTSLYIRPVLFATDPDLSLHGIHEAIFLIILSPVGSYYKEGLNPVRIMLETEDVRAVRGGTGYTKCGGNYAASNRAGARAEEKGFSQVLWLDGVERKYVEEVGSMNVMFKIDGRVVTPALTGSVLPGITRRSCIALMKDWGYEVEERLVAADELAEAAKSGALEEAWGTGTAAVVSPVGELNYKGTGYMINGNKIGALTQRLYDELTGIQWGKRPDKHGWTCGVKE